MRIALGLVMMVLTLNMSFASANLPCSTGEAGRAAAAGMAQGHHDMADMGSEKGGQKPCDMPPMVTCCQSLTPSAVASVVDAGLLDRRSPPRDATTGLKSRFILPDTPPPKA